MTKGNMKRTALTLGGILLAAALCYALYAYLLISSGNFHEVLPGELYRSAQLPPDRLNEVIQKYNIQTVVNLRGENPGQPWYEAEKETVARAGRNLLNFPLKASRVLPNERAHELMAKLKDAPKPILLHCKSGADRSGLASALYLAGVADKGEEASEDQLSLRYGHISLPLLGEFNMDQTFENLEDFFQYVGS